MNSSELLAEACMEVKRSFRVLGSLSESKKNEVLGAVSPCLFPKEFRISSLRKTQRIWNARNRYFICHHP